MSMKERIPFTRAAQSSILFIFILMGLLMIVTVFFTLFISGREESVNPQRVLTNEEEDFLPFVLYTEEQMMLVIHDGFELMGKQGGVIYEDQGGNTPRPPGVDEGSINQNPGIVSGTEGGASYYPQDMWMNTDYWPLLRDEKIPRTEETYGEKYIYGFPFPLPPLDKKDFSRQEVLESIEMQLVSYLENNIPERLDYSTLEEVAIMVDLPEDNPEVEVNLAEKDVSIIVRYPLHATQGNAELDTEEWYFKIEDFPFRGMYGYISLELIPSDVYFLTYEKQSMDITTVPPLIDEFKDRFVVERREGPEGENYDIISVIDTKILINDKPFTFTFLRENRPPDANTIQFFSSAEDPAIYTKWYDILGVRCPNVQRGKENVDPDEDDKYYEGALTAADGGFVLDWYWWDSDGPLVKQVGTLNGVPLYDFNRNCSSKRGIYYTGKSEFDKCGSHKYEVEIMPQACDVGTVIAYKIKDNDDDALALEDLKKRKLISCDAGADKNKCCTTEVGAPPDHGHKWEIGKGPGGGAACADKSVCVLYGIRYGRIPRSEDTDGDGIDDKFRQEIDYSSPNPCCCTTITFMTRCNECGDCVIDAECPSQPAQVSGSCDECSSPHPSTDTAAYGFPRGSCPSVKKPTGAC